MKASCAWVRKMIPWVGRTKVDRCEYREDAVVSWKEILNSASPIPHKRVKTRFGGECGDRASNAFTCLENSRAEGKCTISPR